MAGKRKQEAPDGLAILKSALREKNPASLYVFYGEESYLRSH